MTFSSFSFRIGTDPLIRCDFFIQNIGLLSTFCTSVPAEGLSRTECVLGDVNMNWVCLCSVNMNGVCLCSADMNGVCICGVDMGEVCLCSADMNGVCLCGVDMNTECLSAGTSIVSLTMWCSPHWGSLTLQCCLDFSVQVFTNIITYILYMSAETSC